MKGRYTKLFDNIFCFTKQKYSLYEREQQIEYVSRMSRALNKATRHYQRSYNNVLIMNNETNKLNLS